MLKPVGLIRGHYECRSLKETLPILTDLLALKVVEERKGEAVVKHPNTGWLLVVHEGGPNAPEKPHENHYGFRVAHNKEIDAAYEYIKAHKDKYGITGITPPHAAHFAYSIYFTEPGGNYLEIEYYNPRGAEQGKSFAAPHWKIALGEDQFPGRGYIPQAMSHGTMQCDDEAASRRFYTEVLGLEIVGGGKTSTYIRHPSEPWYIVVLPGRKREYLRPVNRYTLKVASPSAVNEAHGEFAAGGAKIGIGEVGNIEDRDGEVSFMFSDLDKNWWEVAAPLGANQRLSHLPVT